MRETFSPRLLFSRQHFQNGESFESRSGEELLWEEGVGHYIFVFPCGTESRANRIFQSKPFVPCQGVPSNKGPFVIRPNCFTRPASPWPSWIPLLWEERLVEVVRRAFWAECQKTPFSGCRRDVRGPVPTETHSTPLSRPEIRGQKFEARNTEKSG